MDTSAYRGIYQKKGERRFALTSLSLAGFQRAESKDTVETVVARGRYALRTRLEGQAGWQADWQMHGEAV